MDAKLEIVQAVMERFKSRWEYQYKNTWVPSNQNVFDTLEILKPALPGFPSYTREDLLHRVDAFFKCKEDWLAACKHNYSVFLKHIHRWLGTPAKVPPVPAPAGGTPSYKCDCGNELQTPGEICEKCYPHCSECGRQHLKNESCAEFADRDRKLRQMFNRPDKPLSKAVTLSGDNAFDEKKKFTEKDGKLMRSK